MSTIQIGSKCNLHQNNQYLSGVVTNMRKGKVQVKTIDGRSRWLEPRDVKEKLTLVYENEDEEDSSTDTSEDQGQKNLGGEDFDAESSDEDIDYRQRSKSTYIGDGDREDVYTQLREE